MALQGHDHAYLRTYPMKDGKRVDTTNEGTVYIVSVSGVKMYEQDPRDYTEFGMTNTATYQVLDIQIRIGLFIGPMTPTEISRMSLSSKSKSRSCHSQTLLGIEAGGTHTSVLITNLEGEFIARHSPWPRKLSPTQ